MNKLNRKINRSRIANLRKQLKKVDRMEYDLRKKWTPVYGRIIESDDEPAIIGYEKYKPEALRQFRHEYWFVDSKGNKQYRDSVKIMRDLANRGDRWILKAFNSAFFGQWGGQMGIEMWLHTDRDQMVKALYPNIDQRCFHELSEVDFPTYYRQAILGEAFFPTMLLNGDLSDIPDMPLIERPMFMDITKVGIVPFDNRPLLIVDEPVKDVHIADYMPGGDKHGGGYDPKGVDFKIEHGRFNISSADRLQFNTILHTRMPEGKIIAQGSFDRLKHEEEHEPFPVLPEGDGVVMADTRPHQGAIYGEGLRDEDIKVLMSRAQIEARLSDEELAELDGIRKEAVVWRKANPNVTMSGDRLYQMLMAHKHSLHNAGQLKEDLAKGSKALVEQVTTLKLFHDLTPDELQKQVEEQIGTKKSVLSPFLTHTKPKTDSAE